MFHQQSQPPDIRIRLLVDEKIRVVNRIRNLPHDIITQITPQIMRRNIMELEPTVMGALFEVMRTQLHYDRAVPANAVVPDGPDVFREGCPLWVVEILGFVELHGLEFDGFETEGVEHFLFLCLLVVGLVLVGP